MGYPLTTKEYGAAWMYGSKENVVSLGFVTGLDYRESAARPAACAASLQAASLDCQVTGGRQDDSVRRQVVALWRWWSLPPLGGEGWMIVGDRLAF